MENNIIRTTIQDKNIILIGTAHVSRESMEEADRIIREEKPGRVCVELDEGRYASISQKDNWEKLDVVKVLKEGKGFLLIANLVLAGFQRRMGNELGVKPGDEMKTAIETAQELNIPFRLCDREIQTTLRRAWAHCGLWSKSKLMASLLASAFTTEKLTSEEIENLKNSNELDGMMAELAGYLPEIKETLIDERDRYLAAKIWLAANETLSANPAENSNTTNNNTTAAIVGAGHLHGIQTHLEKMAAGEEGTDVSELNTIPKPGAFSKVAGWIIPAIIVILIVIGFFISGADKSLEMVVRWILWNGSLAALGCAIALGHPLAILISFVGAPIATLNPFIGVGMFSGLMQAALRKPRVTDAETLSEDISSIKKIYKNRILHPLLIFFLSSIGGAIGNFISIPAITRLLVK
ncbi:MAG: TraB/GumN family protein [Treponema sp.]|nr:TraB/GumN family protein [Treponema sp.]